MNALDVVCLGLSVVNFPVFPVDERIFQFDVTPVQPITLLPGGDAANQAIVTSKLGLRSALITRRGDDDFGRIMLSLMQSHGDDIELSGVSVDSKAATGVCAMMIKEDGQRHFCSHKGALLGMTTEHVDMALVKRAKVLSYAGMFSMSSLDPGIPALFRQAREWGLTTVADTKYDRRGMELSRIEKALPNIDYFFPSIDEAAAIAGERDPEKIAKAFLDAGAHHVGVKLGGDGCYYQDSTQAFFLPAMRCTVLDTTGAGDNFMSGFITGLAHGWDAKTCCAFGSAAAALCVGQIGPTGAVQSFEQVKEFMDKNRR